MTTGDTPGGSTGHRINPGLGGSSDTGGPRFGNWGAAANPAAAAILATPANTATPAAPENSLADEEDDRQNRPGLYQQANKDYNAGQEDSDDGQGTNDEEEASNNVGGNHSGKDANASDGIAGERSALTDFMKVATPEDLAHISAINKILNPDPMDAQPTTRRVMTEDMEEDYSSTVMQKFPVSSQVWTLWEKKQYIVLSLFTTASMRRLFEQPNSLPMKTISIPGDGNKVHILNVASFGAELDLDLSQWHEAWRNYLSFVRQVYSPSLAARWSNHYDYLASTDDFKMNYKAVLRFDIAERTSYTFRPMKFDLVAYTQRFTQMKVKVMLEEFQASSDTTNTGGPVRNNNTNTHQKKPYSDESRTSKPSPSLLYSPLTLDFAFLPLYSLL